MATLTKNLNQALRIKVRLLIIWTVFSAGLVFLAVSLPAQGQEALMGRIDPTDSHLISCGGALIDGEPAQTESVEAVSDVLTGFEIRPFVFVADEMSTSVLLMSTALTDVDEIVLPATEIGPHFSGADISLRDDGAPPDEVAGDGTFSAFIQMVTPPASYPGNQIVRFITFDLVMTDDTIQQVDEDVAASYGYIQSRNPVSVITLENGMSFSPHVVNVVDPSLIFGGYPTHAINMQACGQRLYSELLGDRYDWLAFFYIYNDRGRAGGGYHAIRNNIQGIGRTLFDNGGGWGSPATLRGAIHLWWKSARSLSHEIFHTWGVHGFEVFGLQSTFLGSSHWGPIAHESSTSVFGGPYTFSSLWDNLDGSYSGCRSENNYVLPIELYLMGLIPSSEISTYEYVVNNTLIGWEIDTDCPSFSRGNFLGDGLSYIDDSAILSAFGPRNPPYPDTNGYRVAAVVVSERPLVEEEWTYIDTLFASHPSQFSVDYQGMAAISYRLRIAPEVTTEPATNITTSSATLNGTVNPRGIPTQVKFQYSEDGSYDNEVIVPGVFSGTSTISVSADVTGLTPGTLYNFRAFAWNAEAGALAGHQFFTSSVDAPSLILPENGDLLDNGCVIGGDLMTWEFDWSDVPGASQYNLWVKHPSATMPAIDSVFGASGYTYSEFGYTEELFGWEWRVRAGSGGDNWGSWSETWVFDVEPANTDCPEPTPTPTPTPVPPTPTPVPPTPTPIPPTPTPVPPTPTPVPPTPTPVPPTPTPVPPTPTPVPPTPTPLPPTPTPVPPTPTPIPPTPTTVPPTPTPVPPTPTPTMPHVPTDTPTPAPTPTQPPENNVFSDGFESGDTSAWSSKVP